MRLALVAPVLLSAAASVLCAQMPDSAGQHTHVRLTGLVLVNGFFNNAAVNNSDVPQWVVPIPLGTVPPRAAGATARQTRLGVRVTRSGVMGARLAGLVEADFFGGQLFTDGGRSFPLLRLRRASFTLDWGRITFLAGQDAPLVADVDPSSFAAMGTPGFAASGNLWRWLPQARFGITMGSRFRVGLEGAVVAPNAGTSPGVVTTQPDDAESSRRPFLQSRVRIGWGHGDTRSSIAFGGHFGWLATPADTLLTTRAAVGTARIAITRYVDIRGELFTGQAIALLGDGGIGQNLGVGGVPVRSTGGWGQLNIRPTSTFEIGGGYGIDNPDDRDLPTSGSRLENASWEIHMHLTPDPLILGVEFRRIRTTYETAVGTPTVNHINVAAGFRF